MDLENMKLGIEICVMTILVTAMIVIIFLLINKKSSISMLRTQIGGFKNKTELDIELNKKMSFFYSLTSNAVYIGLLGTTLGVMIALMGIDDTDKSGLIKTLSLPLLSTAVSIIVAIIGTFCFNHISALIEETLKYWDIHHGYDQKVS